MCPAPAFACVLRPFLGECEFPAMAEVANAVFVADRMGWVRTADHIRQDYARFHGFDTTRDIIMAEHQNRLIGYVRTQHWIDENGVFTQGQVGFVHPTFRRRGVGTLLLDWVETRQREAARAQAAPSVHHVYVTEGEVGRTAMLQRAGYRTARHYLRMERPTLDDLPTVPLPAGFEVRPVRPEHLRAIYDAHQEALVGHWVILSAGPSSPRSSPTSGKSRGTWKAGAWPARSSPSSPTNKTRPRTAVAAKRNSSAWGVHGGSADWRVR
jgi:mycothiol synthase